MPEIRVPRIDTSAITQRVSDPAAAAMSNFSKGFERSTKRREAREKALFDAEMTKAKAGLYTGNDKLSAGQDTLATSVNKAAIQKGNSASHLAMARLGVDSGLDVNQADRTLGVALKQKVEIDNTNKAIKLAEDQMLEEADRKADAFEKQGSFIGKQVTASRKKLDDLLSKSFLDKDESTPAIDRLKDNIFTGTVKQAEMQLRSKFQRTGSVTKEDIVSILQGLDATSQEKSRAALSLARTLGLN